MHAFIHSFKLNTRAIFFALACTHTHTHTADSTFARTRTTGVPRGAAAARSHHVARPAARRPLVARLLDADQKDQRGQRLL